MAKYEIRFSCGHTETIELLGNQDERFARLAWLERNGQCSKCWKAEKHGEAIKTLLDANIPDLTTGSPKQISWADSLRADFFEGNSKLYGFLGDVSEIVDALTAVGADDKVKFSSVDEAKDQVKTYVLNNQLSAKWWIDARSNAQAQRDALKAWAATLC